jgi:exonuclease VII small subunit
MPASIISNMKSPTGVSDFLKVDPQAMIRKNEKEQEQEAGDLNSSISFSWTECPIPATSPTKKKKRTVAAVAKKTNRSASPKSSPSSNNSSSSSSSKKSSKPKSTSTSTSTTSTSTTSSTSTSTTSSTSTSTDSSIKIKDQIRQAQKRLAWLQDQRVVKDKEDYQDQLREAKSQAREQLFHKYKPLLNANSSMNAEYEGQVLETTKVIAYLREDNARLREELKGLQRGIALLKQKNRELEAANASVRASYQDLLDHVEGLTAVQDKLQGNVRVFKQALAKMKQDYTKRTSFYQMETKTIFKYEACLAKVLAQVQSNTHPTSPTLLIELFDMTGEGGAVAAEGRSKAMAKAGLSMDAKQLYQTQKLLDPALFIAEQRKKDLGDDYDSDSDSSSDSDTDYEQDSDDE